MNLESFNSHDRHILRELARRQLDNAMQPSNQKKIQEWYLHNELKGKRPMVHLELWTFSQEVIPPLLQCIDEAARAIEMQLYQNFLNQELFDDDKVTMPTYDLAYDTWFTLFDIPVHTTFSKDASGNDSLGHHFQEVLVDLEEDYHKLKKSTFGANMQGALKKKALLENTFGDILPVRLKMDALYSVPTQMLVHIMSMENMMFAMYDYPELFKEMMDRIANDTLDYFDFLEANGLLLPTVSGENLGQGTWCFNHTLPGANNPDQKGTVTSDTVAGGPAANNTLNNGPAVSSGNSGQLNSVSAMRPLKTTDVWGFMDSQETVGLSPAMYEEFIFPCYKKISSRFGLLSYGCCEPVDPIWDSCISKLENLRKVSISPWCNEAFMAERLRGSNVIYHRKPSPNFLGVGTTLDEAAVREHIRTSLKAARGCHMEITQRDVYTINKDIGKARRYVDIIKEEIQNLW